ncbi:hypothetical protein KUCAC02_012863 [Chaenocephalus aceratus]|uniref:Uncharacterized protein n=1 Tax=Chaenocephalus aceratus TaxID=36190 RepID=A0ACB9XE15_CHAAC|nr:hypothetical protein KUCAC02_012863 [Chaenocephalus aceratus]
MAEYHQLFVGTERLRCPELLFQPSPTGEEQMGLMEALQYVLARYTPEQQEALVSNVFLTGGNMLYSWDEGESGERAAGYEALPVTIQGNHGVAASPGRLYEEKGGEYLSEHCASNLFIPMKLVKPLLARPAEPSVTMPTSTVPSAATTVTPALTSSCSAVTADVSMVAS